MTGTNVIRFRSAASQVSHSNPRTSNRKPNDAANALWTKYLAVTAEAREVNRTVAEAMGRLPEWARTGPGYLAEDGTLKDAGKWPQDVQWPQDLNIRPRKGYMVPVRLGPRNIKDFFDKEVAADPKCRDEARARYRARMMALVSRLRHQRALRARVGNNLDEIERQKRVCIGALRLIVIRLECLPVCANSVAALCLIKSPERDEAGMLTYLEAKVTGAIGRAVREWFHSDAGAKISWVA